VTGGQYNPSFYKIAQKMKASGSRESQMAARIQTEYSGAREVMRAARRLDLDTNIPTQKLQAWWQGNVSGAGEYTDLANALRFLNTETAGVAGQGQVRVAIFRAIMENQEKTASVRQLMGALQIGMSAGLEQQDYLDDRWRVETHGSQTNPLLNPRVRLGYEAIAHMNPATQELPEGSPIELQDYGRKGGEGPGVTKGEGWKPIALQDRKAIIKWVQANRDSPDPEKRALAAQYLHRLGRISISEY
jgi:hypothetical protein